MLPTLARPLAVVLAAQLALSGCSHTLDRRLIDPGEHQTLDNKAAVLKAHLKNGELLILQEWQVDEETRMVSGQGQRAGTNRTSIEEGFLSVSLDSVAIFETNTTKTNPAVLGMAILTGASLALTAYCLSNPKACFGSCPTFYVHNGDRPALMAEGFSSSISPILEASDLDALYHAVPMEDRLEITMVNEALETHVVRHVDLLVCPQERGSRIFATADGKFWKAGSIHPPSLALAPEGDIRSSLATFDGVERWSKADSADLAVQEILEFEFQATSAQTRGLLLASRQTLLSTYLFYQTLAYMGQSAGTWLALLERQSPGFEDRVSGVGLTLGGIEIWLEQDGSWFKEGEIQEHGPLATDIRVIPLPKTQLGSVRMQLRMTKGKHRIDYVALADLVEPVEPTRIHPRRILREGTVDDHALAKLRDVSQTLVTLPGDRYTLIYDLPESSVPWAFFLESRGYYLEWMREEWLAEENQQALAEIFFNPEQALRRMAPEFKALETEMEDIFWGSKYARP